MMDGGREVICDLRNEKETLTKNDGVSKFKLEFAFKNVYKELWYLVVSYGV